jgi:hypothetical protein
VGTLQIVVCDEFDNISSSTISYNISTDLFYVIEQFVHTANFLRDAALFKRDFLKMKAHIQIVGDGIMRIRDRASTELSVRDDQMFL